MQYREFITEGLSPIVYHYAPASSALSILKKGKFILSSIYGSNFEFNVALKGYPYFLSTTRTRHGGYHSMISNSGTLFVLDGNWYNRRYPSKPVDFFSKEKTHVRSEAEDRIFSKDPDIPITGIIAAHAYLSDNLFAPDRIITVYEYKMIIKTIQILIAAKKRNIPAYLYGDFTAWVNFDKRKIITMNKLRGLLSKVSSYQRISARHDTSHRTRNKTVTSLFPWVEISLANNKDQIHSNLGKQLFVALRKGLHKPDDKIYYKGSTLADWDLKDIITMLDRFKSELSHAMSINRRPSETSERRYNEQIVKFMQKNKLSSIEEFIVFLHNKVKWM